MAYDLLIKDGTIVDGSGMPAFRGDVGVRNGKITNIGKLSGPADRTIDAGGLVVSPGFVDNHCHYDAQVTWDPLCTFSCYHGATTVIIGNCSLALAPVKRDPREQEKVLGFLSYVEAIPMEVLQTVDIRWETIPQYMDAVDKNLGVNVGFLIGHSPVRRYVMGDECQSRAATTDEIKAMQGIVHEAMNAGTLGLSVSRNRGHKDPQGVMVPAVWATEEEVFALGGVLRDLGTGVIQSGGGKDPELKDHMMSRLSAASGRPVLYNQLAQHARSPEEWKEFLATAEESTKAGNRAYPLCSPNQVTLRFTMGDPQNFVFSGLPTFRSILEASEEEEKIRAYSDPEVRQKLHDEAVEWKGVGQATLGRNWYDYMWVDEATLEKNKGLVGKTISQIAKEQGKGIIDAFLDLVVEEELEIAFRYGEMNFDKDAMTKILTSPSTVIGLSDGGAHVKFFGGYGYSTRLLGYWVREQGIMSLEQAVRRLTLDSAYAFGIFDRGLIRPGMAADITVFDPETVGPLPDDIVRDFPGGGWRMRQLAEGVKYTVVTGQVLLEDGNHTGALPGRVVKNSNLP